MDEIILTSTKKVLGVLPEDTSFDQDILTYINSAFSNLSQIGVGPEDGFAVIDETADWSDLLVPTVAIESQLKTYIALQVKLLFDPPQNSFALQALERQIEEHAWRLNAMREATEWFIPEPVPDVLDGGGAG